MVGGDRDQQGRTADWLAQVLGISQPGTAHLARRLTELGWVTRDSNGRARPQIEHEHRDGSLRGTARTRSMVGLIPTVRHLNGSIVTIDAT